MDLGRGGLQEQSDVYFIYFDAELREQCQVKAGVFFVTFVNMAVGIRTVQASHLCHVLFLKFTPISVSEQIHRNELSVDIIGGWETCKEHGTSLANCETHLL